VPAVALALLYVSLTGIYVYLAMWRYDIFRAGVDDFMFTQIVNGALRGFSTSLEGSVSHFLVHFSPILYVALPFVKLFDGARGLIVLQCLLTAAIIFPIWGMAAARFPRWLAFAVTAIAAAYPVLSAEAVGDFHELSFAPPLAATLVWAVDRKRRRAAVATAITLALVKEDQFVALAFIGFVVAVMNRQDGQMRSCGLWISAIGIGTAIFYFGILRPIIDPHFHYFSLHYYEWWRQPPTTAGFASPLSPVRLQYLFAILLPLAFLPLASRYILFALPGLAEVLLSHEAITMVLGTQYTATWSAYLLCAFVDGTAVVYRRRQTAAVGALAVALAVSVWTSRYQSPINPGFALHRRPVPADRIRETELNRLPRSARIGTGAWVIGHLGMYPNATIAMFDGATYLVFDAFTDPAYWNSTDKANVQRFIRGGTYREIYNGAGIVVLAKRNEAFPPPSRRRAK
jgi:uncharacterized membrane protein